MPCPRRSSVALLAVVGLLTLTGCGGDPFYAERDATRTPSTPLDPGPAQPSATPSATAGTPSAAGPTPSRTTATTAVPTGVPTQTPTASSLPPPSGSVDAEPSSTSTTRTPRPQPTSAPTSTSDTPTPTGSPSPTPTTSSAPPTTSPPRAEPAYLADLGGPGSGPAPMGGTTYPHSISVSACTIFATQPTYTWSLRGRYQTLQAFVGQDDGSESRTSVLRLAIRGDGRILASRTVRFGQIRQLQVDVAQVQQLSISFTEVSCGEGGGALVLGTPRLR